MPSRASLFCTLTLLGVTVIRLPGAPDGGQLARVEPPASEPSRSAPNRVSSTPESAWSRIYIRDVYVRAAVVRSLSGAAEWLKNAKCRSLLSEFADQHGQSLEETLAGREVALADYLRLLIFEDGETHPQCDRRGILAYTAPTSRVIRVCGRAFASATERDPPEGRATIVHEVLHSLGLGENPPEPRYITYRVKQLCW